jgi:hypothetical protein
MFGHPVIEPGQPAIGTCVEVDGGNVVGVSPVQIFLPILILLFDTFELRVERFERADRGGEKVSEKTENKAGSPHLDSRSRY